MTALRIPPTGRRSGATLTEVLMALLVMGVGLVSVVYLFPLSLQLSIQATKLTHATLLRINAEARIKAMPSIAGGSAIERGIIEDPDADGIVWEHDASKFVFDPLGAVISSGDGTAPAIGTVLTNVDYNSSTFGDFDGDGDSDQILAGSPYIHRFTFGFNTLATAEPFVTLPDSFVSLGDLLAGTFSYNASTPEINVTTGPSLLEYAGQTVQVTALHANARASVIRSGMVNAAGTAVTLATALPAAYDDTTIGRILIDLPERRYTWLATVRRFGVRPSVTIVVFFRRSFSPADERVWILGEPPGSYNEFTWRPTDNGGATTAPPAGLQPGGWMFDAGTFRWWKISGVQPASIGGDPDSLRISVDPEEVDPSPAPRGPGTAGGPVFAMFPRNVIEAYTLKKD